MSLAPGSMEGVEGFCCVFFVSIWLTCDGCIPTWWCAVLKGSKHFSRGANMHPIGRAATSATTAVRPNAHY